MSFIEDLLNEITQKQAADDNKGEDKKPPFFEKKDDDKKDSDDKKEDKKDDDKKDGEKDASELFSKLASLHPELQKLASYEADVRLLAAMKEADLRQALNPAQKAASAEMDVEAQRHVFNAAFATQMSKLAALDPEFQEILDFEQKKAAFNEGFAATIAQAQAAGLVR